MIVFLWAVVMAIVNLVWLALTLLGLPGNWLMIVTAALVTWWVDPPLIGKGVFIAVVLLAGVGEIVEFCAGALGSRLGGGGKWASLAALIGGIAGAILGTVFIPIPVIGTILGAAIGAFAGSAGVELYAGRSRGEAFRAGRGAAIGHVTGNASKFALGCVVWVVLTAAALV